MSSMFLLPSGFFVPNSSLPFIRHASGPFSLRLLCACYIYTFLLVMLVLLLAIGLQPALTLPQDPIP